MYLLKTHPSYFKKSNIKFCIYSKRPSLTLEKVVTAPPHRLGRGLSGITAPPIKVVECPTPQARDHSTSLTIFYRGGAGAALPPAFIGAVAAIPPYSNHIPFLTVFTIGIEQILYFCRTPPSKFQKKRLQPQRVKSNFFK